MRESVAEQYETTIPGEPQRQASKGTGVRTHVLNIAIMVIAMVALFWRVFFFGETLVDLSTLNNQLPWGYYAAEQSDYPYNRRDLTDTYVTREYFIAQSYQDGELPLWNPYTMAGHPIYADGVARILSPFLIFYRYFDVPLGYSLARIAELLLAAIFMYAMLIAFGVGPRGALAGALVFEFSSHSMLHLTGLGWWGGLMWLPLIILFVDRALAKGRLRYAAVAGLFLAAQFFCGYMANQIYYAGALLLYCIFWGLISSADKKDLRTRGRKLLSAGMVAAVTIGTGFSVGAAGWAPIMELLKYSNRRIVPTETGFIYLPPWYILTSVFPDMFGKAYDAATVRLFTALNVSHDHILYIGIAGLAMSIFAIWRMAAGPVGSRNGSGSLSGRLLAGAVPVSGRRLAYFVILLAVSFLVMMTAPLYVHVTRFFPVLQTIRVIVRVGVLFVFSASALTGFGTDLLLKADEGLLEKFQIYWKRFLAGAVVFAALGVIASYAVRVSGLAAGVTGNGWPAFARRAAGALSAQFAPPGAGILVPLLLMAAIYAGFRMVLSRRVSRDAFFCMLIVLLTGDLFWNSLQFNRTFDRARVFPRTEMTDFIKTLPPGRLLTTPAGMESNRRASGEDRKIIAPTNTMLPYRIPVVTGKDQLFPKWYRDFGSLIEPQPYLSHVVFDQSSSPFLDLLDVRYVLTYNELPAPSGCELLKTAEGLSLYENRNALPRAFFTGRLIAARDDREDLREMKAPGFDPHKMAVVIGDLPVSECRVGEASIVEDRRNRVRIETDNPGEGFLVLSDNYYTGWQADVDGVATPIIRTNHTMRGVRVPAGRHMVSFVFMPRSLRLSAIASLAGLVIVVIVLAGAWLGSRRKTEQPASGRRLP